MSHTSPSASSAANGDACSTPEMEALAEQDRAAFSTMDVSTCPGPHDHPIPLLHFSDECGTDGKLAVSLADGRAVLSTAHSPAAMLSAATIMLNPADRQALGRLLLADDDPPGEWPAITEEALVERPNLVELLYKRQLDQLSGGAP